MKEPNGYCTKISDSTDAVRYPRLCIHELGKLRERGQRGSAIVFVLCNPAVTMVAIRGFGEPATEPRNHFTEHEIWPEHLADTGSGPSPPDHSTALIITESPYC